MRRAVPVAEQLLVAGPALVAADLDLPALDEPLDLRGRRRGDAPQAVDDGDGPGRFLLTGTATDVAVGRGRLARRRC